MIRNLSYSSINTYLLCPRSWRFRYVDKVKTPVSPNLIFGSAFHDTVEAIVEANAVNEPLTVPPPEVFERNWYLKLETEDIDWGEDVPGGMLATGMTIFKSKECMETIQAIVPMIGDAGEPIVERRVNLTVPGVPIPIIGYVDIVTQDGVPCDIKTAARKWSTGQAGDELQPLFYLAALNQEGFPLNSGWKFRHYVFTKTKTPAAQVFEVERKPSEVFWLFGLIADVWRGIEREVFPPQPNGWKCSEKYCEFWGICRGV